MRKFVLFDIDGTLVDSGGAGRVALNKAFQELTGIADGFRAINFAGKTDFLIIREAVKNWHLDWEESLFRDFIDLYLQHLAYALANTEGHVKKGVKCLLERLSECEGVFLGLLTGNIEQGARLKLEPHCLNRFFPVGAFGSDSADRNLLLPVAVRRLALSNGVEIPYADCFVIGDTPKDVECAAFHGASSIAVATGPYSVDTLQESGAHLVVEDLGDAERILAWISDGTTRRSG